jgi:glutamate-1-semialdehyde aminotransferase
MGPSGYEVGFISEAHTVEQLNWAVSQFKEALKLTFSENTVES